MNKRTLDILRYKAPLLFVHLLLIVLGVLNLYPFLWMLGTSMKAEAEASTDRMRPVPVAKFQLVENLDIHRVLPLALQPGLQRAENQDARANELSMLRSKLTLLDRMRRPSDEPARTHGVAFAGIARVPLEQANAELAQMAAIGLLEPDGVYASPEGNIPAYRLTEAGRGPIVRNLVPRQVHTLLALYMENNRRAETRSTFAPDRVTVGEYAASHGIEDEKVEVAERELREMREAGYLADGTWQVENYWVVLKGENFLLNFLTSVMITIVVVLGTLYSSSMLGYALARIRFPGRFWVLGAMIFASVLPSEARMIPIFKMLLSVNGFETLWGLTIWLTSFGVGNALLMAGFFLTLPKEVNEAAAVDGAGVFRAFFDIMLPMARPIFMTVGLFAFLTSWNEFLVPLLCTISRPSMQPLSVAVYNFQAGHPGKWHEINAAASIMIIPVILGFLAVQKHVVNSIAVGAVKG